MQISWNTEEQTWTVHPIQMLFFVISVYYLLISIIYYSQYVHFNSDIDKLWQLVTKMLNWICAIISHRYAPLLSYNQYGTLRRQAPYALLMSMGRRGYDRVIQSSKGMAVTMVPTPFQRALPCDTLHLECRSCTILGDKPFTASSEAMLPKT